MKWKKYVWLLAIPVFAVIVWIIWNVRTPFLTSTSPDGAYRAEIYSHQGTQLLNAPAYLTITVQKNQLFSRKTTIYTHIDNDDDPIEEDQNIHIFWEDSQLTILLLGEEQLPEMIELSLGETLSYQSRQLELPPGSAEAVLQKHGVDLAVLSPYLYLNPQTEDGTAQAAAEPSQIFAEEGTWLASPSGSYGLSLEGCTDGGVNSHRIVVRCDEAGALELKTEEVFRDRDTLLVLWDDAEDRVWAYSGDLGTFYWDIVDFELVSHVYTMADSTEVPAALRDARPRVYGG